MDDAAAAMDDAAAARGRWTQWEEEVVSNERGRRLVHYFLRGPGEERELAVVGREGSPRHMLYAVQDGFLRSLAAADGVAAVTPSPFRSPASVAGAAAEGGVARKWRSRREVVDWLSSLVSGSSFGSPSMDNRFLGNSYDDNDVNFTEVTASKDVSPREILKDFKWLGTSWHCQKRWKHYKSFRRRGITILVHSFVYVMSEKMKRLIAYVEDLYEDTNAFKMIKVRWFDKVDEVGVSLPMDVDDREIFLSLGRQDLNVECIDGLAVVLSVQHFEKYKSAPKYQYWQPYICRWQIDNDEVKPFDISQLQGYWSQEVLRTMFNAASSLKVRFKFSKSEPSSDVGQKRKRYELSDDALDLRSLCPGCHVEVLSQDSGIRGCWFRCLILKKHKDKIKVRYLDIQDADDTGNLEEWVLLTRVAKPDHLGIRLPGRSVVRPQHVHNSKTPSIFDVGAIVDAWWHGGWWEGILLQVGNDGRLKVYFPGEKRMAEFGEDDLRRSLDWFGSKWNLLKERKDIASKLSSSAAECEDEGLIGKQTSQIGVPSPESELHMDGPQFDDNLFVSKISRGQKRVLADLTSDLKLDNLKWRPRKRSRRSGSKRQSEASSGSSNQGDMESSGPSGSFAQLSMVPDEEICKGTGEQHFMGVPKHVSNLVVSR